MHLPGILILIKNFHHCLNQFTVLPDIAGKGIANPIGQIWSGAMMLNFLGEHEASKTIENSIEKTLANKENRTKDLQGNSDTVKCTKAVFNNI